ncbi:MAG: polysaccharide pyruvyl transferase family protein [Treponema sp.]|nr:polysaccharide pyruvyl transferase family protein [Treponema sp.]
MKIGIITFCFSKENYGQVLQNFALQTYLQSLGHETFTICYDGDRDFDSIFARIKYLLSNFNPLKIYRFFIPRLLNKRAIGDIRQFSDFKTKYIPNKTDVYRTYTALCKNPPRADAYIAGSDQIWNYHLFKKYAVKNNYRTFMLDFGSDSIKRISYAASWGITSLSKKYTKTLSSLISKFYAVSVREKSGNKICERLGRNDAETVPDPTMLLDVCIYEKIIEENVSIEKRDKFLFLYILGENKGFDIKKVYDFAHSKNIKVVYVTDLSNVDKWEKTYPTIPEWLWYIKNADYVVTNSFHCSVFSILFQKHFGVIALGKKRKSLNTRVDELFALQGIESRYITEENFEVLEKEYLPTYFGNDWLKNVLFKIQE